MMNKVSKVFFPVLMLVAAKANAGVIHYDETVSGDLSLDSFTFNSAGLHVFKGSSFASQSDGAFSQDGDSFDIDLLEGLEIKTISFSADLLSSSNVSTAAARGSIRDEFQTVYLDTVDILGTVPFAQSNVDFLPLEYSLYSYRAGSGLDLTVEPGSSDYYIAYDWSFAFEVGVVSSTVEVSAPMSATLLGLGLLGLVTTRKSRSE